MLPEFVGWKFSLFLFFLAGLCLFWFIMECKESDTASDNADDKKKYIALTDTEVSQYMFYDDIKEIVRPLPFGISSLCS